MLNLEKKNNDYLVNLPRYVAMETEVQQKFNFSRISKYKLSTSISNQLKKQLFFPHGKLPTPHRHYMMGDIKSFLDNFDHKP